MYVRTHECLYMYVCMYVIFVYVYCIGTSANVCMVELLVGRYCKSSASQWCTLPLNRYGRGYRAQQRGTADHWLG